MMTKLPGRPDHTTCRTHSGWPMALFAALLAQGCAAPTIVDENSHLYPPPVGTEIVFNTDVPIRPDRARATIQRGAIAPAVHPFDIWCQLEVRDVMPVEQTVRADTFTLHKVSRETTQVVQIDPPQRVASAGVDGGSYSDVTQIWHLWLSSPRQPNVRRLSCGGVFDSPSRAQYPSVLEIRAALGPVATLRLPPSEPAAPPP